MIKDLFGLTHIAQTDRPVRWILRFSYIVLDATIYVTGLFLCIETALLRLETIVDLQHVLTVFFMFVLYLFLSRSVYIRLFQAPLFYGLALEFISVFILVVGPTWLALQRSASTNFSWLPFWWHQVPDRLFLFLCLSPLLAVWLALGFFVLSSQVARNRPRVPVLVVSLIATLVILQYIGIMGKGFRALEFIFILVFFAFPVQAAIRGRPRLFARTLLVFLIAAFSLWHFLGLLPVVHGKNFADNAGVTLTYPPSNGRTEVSPPLIADIAPDPAGGLLYVAGGRSGKFLALDLGKASISESNFPGANLSQVAVDPWNHNVYVLNVDNAEVMRFSQGSTDVEARYSVSTDWGFTPRKIIPFDNLAYVSYSERPGIAEFSVEKFQQEGGIRFRNLMATTFRTGAWDMVAVREKEGLFVVPGAQGAEGMSMLIGIDPLRFKPSSVVVLPDSGPALAAAGSLLKIYATSFFKSNIYEIDIAEMKLGRVLPGPPACRAITFDPTRKYLYAAGYYNGQLMVVDAVSGAIIRSDFACNRIVSVKLDEKRDRLWIACIKGIYKVDLAVYLGKNSEGTDYEAGEKDAGK